MNRQYSAEPEKLSAVNAPLLPGVLLGSISPAEPQLQLACEHMRRYVWHTQFGAS